MSEDTRPMRQFVLMVFSFLLAFWAQRQFAGGGIVRDALLLYAGAGIAFVWAVRKEHIFLRRRAEPIAPVPWPSPLRVLLFVAGAGLALAGMLRFRSLVADNPGFWMWLAGLLLMVVAVLERPRWNPRAWWGNNRAEALVFLGILGAAILMRVYRLGQFPPAVYLDEADNGLEALKLLDGGQYIPYTRASNGHATLFLYLLGFGFRLFGETGLAMRLVTAAVGVGTVAAFYFLARELFGMRPAQCATLALAFSRWHVNFSRVAFEGILTPFFAVLTMLFLVRAVRFGRWKDYTWAGLALGLGLQGYMGYRVFPIIAALYLLARILVRPAALKRCWPGLLVFLLAAIIGFGPLLVYFGEYPGDFVHRAQQASVSQDIQQAGSYQPLWDNVRKTALMFTYQGDPRPRHNVPGAPMLDPWTAMLFMLGLAYVLFRSPDPERALLWIWLPIGALPGVLSLADSNPHSLRTIVNLPAVFLIVGAFWEPAVSLARRTFRDWGRQGVLAACLAVVAVAGWANFDLYFHEQASNRSVYYDFDPAPNLAAQYALAHAETHRLLISPALTNHSAIKFIDYRVPYEDFLVNQHLPLRDAGDRPVLFILESAHQMALQRLQELYPGGISETHVDRYGELAFYSFEITPGDILSIQGLPGRYFAGLEPEGAPAWTRREPALDLRWDAPPVPLPFSVEWSGSLFVPAFGPYTLILEVEGGPADVEIGGERLLQVRDGRADASRLLPGGFHPLRVVLRAEAIPAGISLRWIRPDGTEEVIPQSFLYDAELSRFGLLGRYFRGAERFEGMPDAMQIDPYIAPNDLLPAPFSIEWTGTIYIPLDGTFIFGTNSDDGSFLFVDDQLIVDNGGHHGDIYREGAIDLTQGFHDIVLRYFQVDGGRKIELWWTPPGGPREQVPAKYLRPPGVSLEEVPLLETVPAAPPAEATPAPPISAVLPLNMWGSEGEEDGQFRTPRGVAVGPQGWVYVADAGNGRVQFFLPDGTFLGEWSAAREPLGEPFDIAVAEDGRVYVLDSRRQVIARYAPDGTFEVEFGAELGLYGPRGLGIDAQGNLYVADTGSSRVLKLSPDGALVAVLAEFGVGAGQVNQPTDVAVDASGRVYIADTLNTRLQVLDGSGSYVGEWPLAGANTTDSPHLAIDAAGRVVVTDPEAHAVRVFSTQGELLAQWGGEGSAPGQFRKAVGVAIAPDGLVVVSDVYNHRIQVFGIQ